MKNKICLNKIKYVNKLELFISLEDIIDRYNIIDITISVSSMHIIRYINAAFDY